MKKYMQLIKNTGLFALASISTKLISFIFLPLYTAFLTTEEYAIADLSMVMQSLLWPILSLSLTEGVLRFALDKEYDKDEVFTNATLLIVPGTVISCFIFLFVNFNDSLYAYRGYFLAYYIVVSFNTYLSVVCRTIDKIKLIVSNSILSSLLIAVCNLLFLTKFGMGVKGYFGALIIGNGVSALRYFFAGDIRTHFKLSAWNRKLIKQILIYSIPMIPNTIFWWINSSLDKICLTSMVGLTAVGLYSVADKVSSALSLCTNVFNQAWSISAVKQYKEQDSEAFFSNIFNIYNTVLSILAAVLLVMTKYIAKIMFANDFYEAWVYVPFLVIAFYFNGLNVYYGTIFTTNKKTGLIFWTTGIGAVFNIVFNILLINYVGTIGAAIATAFSNYVVYQVRCIWARQYISIRSFPIRNIITIVGLTVLCIATVLELQLVIICSFLIVMVLAIFTGYKYVGMVKKLRNAKGER